MGRSVFYWLGLALLYVAYKLGGWWGFAVVTAFACGYHLCYRLLRGHWMPPED